MIKIIQYNNIINIDIEIKEEKKEYKKSYLDVIIENKSIDIDICTYINFIYFLQQNRDAVDLVHLDLYKNISRIIKIDDKKIKRKLLKSTNYYIQAFFNHNNNYISNFLECVDIIKRGRLCV